MTDEVFTQEDIDALMTPLYIPPTDYFVYYNSSTGEILAVTSEVLDNYENKLTVTYDEVVDFLNGKKRFLDYAVIVTLNSANPTIVFKHDNYEVKTNLFVNIELSNTDADLVVTWDNINAQWIFNFDNSIEANPLSVLNFFIVKENDFNFLIRTIKISMKDLLLGSVCIPFETEYERNISNISMITKMAFNTYGLKTINE